MVRAWCEVSQFNVTSTKLLVLKPSLSDRKDREEQTALHLAARDGNDKMVETLLALCPYLYGGTDISSNTPLHYAASGGHSTMEVQVLQDAVQLPCQKRF